MKRALLILSGLGLLCALVAAVYLSLPSQVAQQLPDQQTISLVETVILVALPILGIVDAILGVVAAGQRHASRWTAAFVAMAIISLPAFGCGFILSLLDAFPGNQGIGVIATALLCFPIVIFLAALVFALRRSAPPGASFVSVSHAIDSRPPRE